MGRALILMLPPFAADAPGAIRRWWLVADGAVIDSGNDGEWPAVVAGAPAVIALAPADDAPVHYHPLPGLTPPQARAAARIEAAARVLGDTGQVHIAAGAALAGTAAATTVVTHGAMMQWRALLAEAGVMARALVPVAALVAAPAPGAALRAEVGGAPLLRTEAACAAADPAVDALRLHGLTWSEAAPAETAAWLAALADYVPLDLLSGIYALKPAAALSPDMQRWLGRLMAALVLLTLAVPLAQAWQRGRTIAAADTRALAAAADAGVQASDPALAEAELDRRLAARGGGPLSLTAPLGGLYRSLQAQAPVAVRSMAHAANGTLAVTLASPRIEDVNAVLSDLQARGFVVTGQPLTGTDGMQMATITIRAVP